MKYDVVYSCGHKGTVDLFGPTKDRESKIEWYGSQALCPDCYKAKMEKKDKEMGLVADVRLDGRGLFYNKPDDEDIAIVFYGDTYPHKTEIQSLGAVWTDEFPSEGLLNDMIMGGSGYKRWVLYTSMEKFDETIKKVESIANVKNYPSDVDIMMYSQQKQRQLDKMARVNNALEELGPKPEWPEEISKVWPEGGTWNCKFYGKPGKWMIYIKNKEIQISDDLKKQMEEVFEKRNEWKKKKEEIERG